MTKSTELIEAIDAALDLADTQARAHRSAYAVVRRLEDDEPEPLLYIDLETISPSAKEAERRAAELEKEKSWMYGGRPRVRTAKVQIIETEERVF